jgi:hypothetical protein
LELQFENEGISVNFSETAESILKVLVVELSAVVEPGVNLLEYVFR